MSNVIELKKKRPPKKTKVAINWRSVKYLEPLSSTKSRVHFIDGSSLIIYDDPKNTHRKMMKALGIRITHLPKGLAVSWEPGKDKT